MSLQTDISMSSPATCASLLDSQLTAIIFSAHCMCLQCFDAVGWAAGRASGLLKTEWWGAGVVISL